MAEPIDWMQYAEKSSQGQGQGQGQDWSQYAEPNQHTSIGQGIKEGFQGAFPRALDMIQGGASGLYDMVGGNIPESENTFTDALKTMFGWPTQNERQYGYQPREAARDVASGLTKGVRIVGNAPGHALNYAGKVFGKEAPDITLPDKINNFDIDKLYGATNERPASNLVQGLASYGPALVASFGNPYAASVLHDVGENENPITNLLAGGILHGATKAIPAATKGTVNAVKHIPEAIEKITPERYSQPKTAAKSLKMLNEFTDYFEKGYKESLSTPGLPSKADVGVNRRMLNEYKKAAPDLHYDVEKAIQSGNLTDIHWGASELGQYLNKEKKAVTPDKKGIRTAKLMKERFEKTLDESLDKVPEAKAKYRALDTEYESTMGRINPKIRYELREYGKGKLTYKDVLRKIRAPETGKYFRARFGEEFPGIESAPHAESWKNIPGIREAVNLASKHIGKKK